MKYCTKCGSEIMDEAVICPKCGCMVEGNTQLQTSETKTSKSGLKTAAKVFMIIGTVLNAFCYLIPLAWSIPMTVVYCKKIKNGEKVSTGFKVCSLLFVSLIGGILMLCDND